MWHYTPDMIANTMLQFVPPQDSSSVPIFRQCYFHHVFTVPVGCIRINCDSVSGNCLEISHTLDSVEIVFPQLVNLSLSDSASVTNINFNKGYLSDVLYNMIRNL